MKKGPCGKHASLELEPGIKTERLGPKSIFIHILNTSLMESDPFLIELVLAVLIYEAVK